APTGTTMAAPLGCRNSRSSPEFPRAAAASRRPRPCLCSGRHTPRFGPCRAARTRTPRMPLPMTWDEWAAHDATALAERVRKRELTPAELAAQAAAAIERVNPQVSAVIEVFDDVVANPLADGMNP